MKTEDTTTIETAAPETAAPVKPAKRAPGPAKPTKKRKPKPPRLTKAGAARAAKAAAARAAKPTRIIYRDDQIISVLNLDNPRRPGTPQYDRYEVIKKFRGKSVGKFKAGGGDTLALRYAAKQMHASVE